jgi:hypothetical protein
LSIAIGRKRGESYLHISYGGLQRDLAEYVEIYNTDRAHNGRITKGRIPNDQAISGPLTRAQADPGDRPLGACA